MTVRIHTDEAPYRASHAVLLYGQYRPSYASVHEVAVDENGDLKIEAGVPATVSGLSQLFEKLDPARQSYPTFFEPSVLSRGPGWLVWWMKPQVRRVWFQGKEFRRETAEVPHPGLVFAVTRAGWSVFALAGRSRPRPGTRLYQAPYLNVWEGGRICAGSAHVPTGKHATDVGQWERCFFDSRFTHPNVHEKNRLVKYRGGPIRFWNAMLQGKFEVFPKDVLVPGKWTVSDLLADIGRAR